ncbi:MAG: hypothetical protein NTU53_10870 [Planctomycetota bacterium]|nr:hypothetical protein [Planctomycetota bacterium]
MKEHSPSSTAAPADLRAQRRWPLWRKIAAYTILTAIALASIWFIDRRVDALAKDAPAVQSK